MFEFEGQKWYVELTTLTGNAVATAALLATIGTPKTGSGLLKCIRFLENSFHTAFESRTDCEAVLSHLTTTAEAANRLVLQYPILASIQAHDINRPTYGRICQLASLAPDEIPRSLALASSWLLIDSLRSQEPLTQRSADQLSTLQRAANRSAPDRDWLKLRASANLDLKDLEPIVASPNANAEASNLARKLISAIGSKKPLPALASATKTSQSEIPRKAIEDQKQSVDKPIKAPRERKVTFSPPSVKLLKSSASYSQMYGVFALECNWSILSPALLKECTTEIYKELMCLGNERRSSMAAAALLSLLINHDVGPTLSLSLLPNQDLWIDVPGKAIKFNRKAYLGLKGELSPDDIYVIFLPPRLAWLLEQYLKKRPESANLETLLGVDEKEKWLEECDHYIISKGNSAHHSRSARFAHSLGVTYVHCGASPEISAMATLSPALAGDSALNYLRIENQNLLEYQNKTYEFLGFEKVEDVHTEGWFGCAHFYNEQDLTNAWNSASSACRDAINTIKNCNSASECVVAFNAGSSANAFAFKTVSAGRPHSFWRPSNADVLSDPVFVYTDDKDTNPPTSRLTPRTTQLDQIVSAQQYLTKVLLKKLKRFADIGQISKLLTNPDRSAPFFLEIRCSSKTSQQKLTINAMPMSLDCVKQMTKKYAIALKGARQFWASNAVLDKSNLWMERIVLGHGRQLASVGSWCTAIAPIDLLKSAKTFMQTTLSELDLKPYADLENYELKFLTPKIDLCSSDKSSKQGSANRQLFSDHYCSEWTLPACQLVDDIRINLRQKCSEDVHVDQLLSIVFVDGIVYPDDISKIWNDKDSSMSTNSGDWHAWTRISGQEIAMPCQPATRIHASRSADKCDLDVALNAVRDVLKSNHADVKWPQTNAGLLRSLCWLASHFVRLHVPPFLLFCYEPKVASATLNNLSLKRLMGSAPVPELNESDLSSILLPRQYGSSVKHQLDTFLYELGKFVKNGEKSGESLRRYQKFVAWLRESYDIELTDPLTRLLMYWVIEEGKLWQERKGDLLKISSAYQYASVIMHRLKSFPNYFNPFETTDKEWQDLFAWILDVSDEPADSQESTFEARMTAIKRIVATLGNSGKYRFPRVVGNDKEPVGIRAWTQSASRVYLDDQTLFQLRQYITAIYGNWELQCKQMQGLLEFSLAACPRASEPAALRLVDVSDLVCAVTTSGMGHLKTEYSRHPVYCSDDVLTLLNQVKRGLEGLPLPPQYMFSQEGNETNLAIGREKEAVLVDLARTLLGDSNFCFHSFRGNGLWRKFAGCEAQIRHFLNDSMPLSVAGEILDLMAGGDPRHLANCFGITGHASHITPGSSYLALWPILYSVAMRRTQAGDKLKESICKHLPVKNYPLLRQHRVRSGVVALDEWHWALSDTRQQRPVGDIPSRGVENKPSMPASATATIHQQVSFGVLHLLGIPSPSAEHESGLSTAQAATIRGKLLLAPRFRQLHHRTHGRIDKQGRPKKSSQTRFLSPEFGRVLDALTSCNSNQLEVLRALLTDKCQELSVVEVESALCAIPPDFTLELCWPRGCLPRDVTAQLSLTQRVEGLKEVKQAKTGIRARVVPPNASQHFTTHVTTLARAALVVLSSLNFISK